MLAAAGHIYGGLIVASGTSFATPYAAGVATLIRQVHPNLTAYEVINRMATTAKPVTQQFAQREPQSYMAPSFQQGGGLIDAYAAVFTNTVLNVSDLAFNDTKFISPRSFQITNVGNQSVTYEITHEPTASVGCFMDVWRMGAWRRAGRTDSRSRC